MTNVSTKQRTKRLSDWQIVALEAGLRRLLEDGASHEAQTQELLDMLTDADRVTLRLKD